jgi:ribosomal protein L24E
MNIKESKNTPGMWYIMEDEKIIRVHYNKQEAMEVMKAISLELRKPRRKKPTSSERNMELDALVKKTMRDIKKAKEKA